MDHGIFTVGQHRWECRPEWSRQKLLHRQEPNSRSSDEDRAEAGDAIPLRDGYATAGGGSTRVMGLQSEAAPFVDIDEPFFVVRELDVEIGRTAGRPAPWRSEVSRPRSTELLNTHRVFAFAPMAATTSCRRPAFARRSPRRIPGRRRAIALLVGDARYPFPVGTDLVPTRSPRALTSSLDPFLDALASRRWKVFNFIDLGWKA